MKRTEVADNMLAFASGSIPDDDCWLLNVLNQSGSSRRFTLLPMAPRFIPSSEPGGFHICAYQASLKVATAGGQYAFIIPLRRGNHAFVITGTAGEAITPTLQLLPTDSKSLGHIGSFSYQMTMPEGSEPTLTAAPTLDAGHVSIQIDNSFNFPNTKVPFVGIGIADPHRSGIVIPVVVWDAIPGTTSTFDPIFDTWRVASMSGEGGSVVSSEQFNTSLPVTFTDSERTAGIKCDTFGKLSLTK